MENGSYANVRGTFRCYQVKLNILGLTHLSCGRTDKYPTRPLFLFCIFISLIPQTHTHTYTHTRFVSEMPTPTLFVVFSFLLRIVEGVGTAMYSSVSYTVLIQLYPDKKGTIVVSVSLPVFLHIQVMSRCH